MRASAVEAKTALRINIAIKESAHLFLNLRMSALTILNVEDQQCVSLTALIK
jgi:hypothetical protein